MITRYLAKWITLGPTFFILKICLTLAVKIEVLLWIIIFLTHEFKIVHDFSPPLFQASIM